MSISYLTAALLGLVEGLTEFIPVSSTGHLILLIDLLDFQAPPGKSFEVVIQLGAILAVCWAYRLRLTGVVARLISDVQARSFATGVLIAFIPAAIVGAVGHKFIKEVLFSPWVVSVSLILGGLAILVIERVRPSPSIHAAEDIRPWTALKIGLCQCVAMIPGISRSGATIMGALMLKVDRQAATEFSFFIAIPTMLGATLFDLHQNIGFLSADNAAVIAVGFIAAFIAALVVVRTAIRFIGRHGFAPFAWYRIALGGVLVAVLLLR